MPPPRWAVLQKEISASVDAHDWSTEASAKVDGRVIERVAKPLRLFLAAQIAIQLGLNIPASAIYFDHYSVAGLLVNMAAIPLAAVLTPGSLLVGLLDMIPVVGPWLAIPPAWVMERLFDLFLWISATCAAHLPYPEMVRWPGWAVVGYYALLIAGAMTLRSARRPTLRGPP